MRAIAIWSALRASLRSLLYLAILIGLSGWAAWSFMEDKTEEITATAIWATFLIVCALIKLVDDVKYNLADLPEDWQPRRPKSGPDDWGPVDPEDRVRTGFN